MNLVMENFNDEIITYDEYNDSLSSDQYIDLVNIIKVRLTINNDSIDQVIDNHFSFKDTIKKNYNNFLDSIQNYNVRASKTTTNFIQPTLF